ncbi:MAG: hypothetical protein ACI8W7_000644 [Gammaproteobacteria bacterium]|jgi:hypothetical protein
MPDKRLRFTNGNRNLRQGEDTLVLHEWNNRYE